MPQLVANAAFTYANRALKPGDRFEASDKDAKILKLTKRASDDLDHGAEPPEPKRNRRYQRRDMLAED